MPTPTLYCPFGAAINPCLHEIENATTQWLQKCSLLRTDSEILHNQRGKFTHMVARMFPIATCDRLQIASDLNAWLFLIDDHWDSHSDNGNKKLLFEGFIRKIIEIVEKPGTKATGPVLNAFVDIWDRLCLISDSDWQARFAASLKDAVLANLWRMSLVDNRQLPSLNQYIQHRNMIGGANTFNHLAELMAGVRLPATAFDNPIMQDMLRYCADTICFANDIFSFRKELREGDHMNLVMIIRSENKVPLNTALNLAVQIHDQEVRLFEQCALILSRNADAQIRLYIAALGTMMRGNIDWSTLDTDRYAATTQPVHNSQRFGA